MSGPLFAGLDLGSTSIKLLILDGEGVELLTEQVATPWRHGPGGTTELDADALTAAIEDLLGAAARRLAEVCAEDRADADADARIAGLAIAGMGETGFLVDGSGAPVSPGFAWFDPRGREEALALPAEVRREFAGRTGLPLGAQVTVAKLAHLRARGMDLEGKRWLNLPEFVAMTLGGDVALEYSLTSRTGLLDQDTGEPWPAMLEALGVGSSFLPPLRSGGDSWGAVGADVPPPFAGARLAVAGHDHLVAAEAGGGIDPDRYHVSMGTAEVLLRVIDGPLGYEARTRLAERLINEVRHVVPGKHVLVAGVKSGLVLRRVLQSVGISDRAGRDALDAAVMELPYEGALEDDGIEISGARNDDGVFRMTVRTDGVSPAEIFGAALRHSNDEIAILIEAMDREIPPATSSLLTGGWVGMRAVQRARGRVLPDIAVSSRGQDTAYGAARTAMRSTSPAHPRAE
ncbi:hypothetical protein JD276_05625 [Leucobacter sp. CSA1]|uniref:Carbohydrate kinase FGGY N-terminal domain-containing protein n=1 Tax=Leucobacter chromiisoli TaxID=2796471 RepID=A0A934Q6D7_9MICO|nr:FGGY family carbohydrate kinase [Leucobacter chromiisoli]MBK0418511.1 hypothetical protein [Leucobacter chromiisoli]